jgi:hypothetical protein
VASTPYQADPGQVFNAAATGSASRSERFGPEQEHYHRQGMDNPWLIAGVVDHREMIDQIHLFPGRHATRYP